MKKIYMIPTVEVLNLAPTALIANSYSKGSTPTNPNDFEVKGNSSRDNNYDVWDDDWSK